MANNRDNFTKKTRDQLAKRAGWLCSFPSCRKPTVGATADSEGIIDIGIAAHICAAAPGGPRYDATMSSEERSSVKNGIWMCSDHGKAIDSPDSEFTVERLREWKKRAEEESRLRVLRGYAPLGPTVDVDAALIARVRAAAEADLQVFHRTAKWPPTPVALTLKVQEIAEPTTTRALANAVTFRDDLILVAPPGMGKTSTLFQIAEGVLARGNGSPLVIPLGDWAAEDTTILDSILNRPAFRGISEENFREAAGQPGIVLLLDGWNELDGQARSRAHVQVARLKAELPNLGLVVSTRKQVLDVPFEGMLVEIFPLNEEQQLQIAAAMRGESGKEIVDRAWRTAGVRELVTIPLYLTALLTLPEGSPFPTTKEEVLRRFVDAHEREPSHAEELRTAIQGVQQYYLEGIAVSATRTTNTTIADDIARRAIAVTQTTLADKGQITNRPQPNDVLDVLVNNHVLIRTGDGGGYSFQHQQFQEWYASHFVERRILHEINDPGTCETLKAEVLNLPVWEEPILFAVERLARGDTHQRTACGQAILAAFEVDPILAAEMIFRSSEEVWMQISSTIEELVFRWHAPGKADRAFRFMLTSGRPEFFDAVWPLITDENDQISLPALRLCAQFRPSIIGPDADKKIKALSKPVRTVLLCEMAYHSGLDGLDLASDIAKDDPEPEVQASVVDMLAFRRADRHIILVLKHASERTFDLIARKGLVDEVEDEHVKAGIIAARKRQAVEASDYDRLRAILNTQDEEDRSAEVTGIIRTADISQNQDTWQRLIYMVHERYPRAVSDGMLDRVLAGRTLIYGTADILASAGFTLEDDTLLQIAVEETPRRDDRANAAASVLGPRSVGIMIDALLAAHTKLRDATGKHDRAASERYHVIQERILHVPVTSLMAAIQERSPQANNAQMTIFAELLSRFPDRMTNRDRRFDAATRASIRVLAEDWGSRLLASGNADRYQLASIAELARHVPDVSLLPLLKRMLDDELRRYRAFREEAEAVGWRQCEAVQEARHIYAHQYQQAFLEIDDPDTRLLMREYLADPNFCECAAQVLASQWIAANEPPSDKRFFGGVDFSRVGDKRAARIADPAATSEEAEAIFAAIEPLIADGATEQQNTLAVALGIVAVRLPHGQRDAMIEKLISLASWRIRSKLLLSLTLSGAEVDSRFVVAGFAEILEASKQHTWILTQSDGHMLGEWLQIFPFSNCPQSVLEVVRDLPEELPKPRSLEELFESLAATPSEGGEGVLFALAEEDPRCYQNYAWRAATLKLGTESAAHRLIDLTANGSLDGSSYGGNWNWSRELGALIAAFPEVRRHVYELLNDGILSPPLALLAQAVAEYPDEEGLLLLVNIENEQGRAILRWDTIEKSVSEHVPVEGLNGPYNIVPKPAIELRQKLLSITTDGGPTDAAARCLREIDAIRDKYGLPISEPRHPDLTSGKPWPILSPDPSA